MLYRSGGVIFRSKAAYNCDEAAGLTAARAGIEAVQYSGNCRVVQKEQTQYVRTGWRVACCLSDLGVRHKICNVAHTATYINEKGLSLSDESITASFVTKQQDHNARG